MANLHRRISDEDHTAISQAITAAEWRSGCEIVPVLASSSGRYDRGDDIVGLIFALTVFGLCWTLVSASGADATGLWTEDAPFGLGAIIAIIIGGFAIGAFLATRFSALKTLFVSRQEMTQEVIRAAEACFYARGLRKAPNTAGILIYVSAYERMVHILGDETVAARLDDAEWSQIRDALVAELRKGRPAAGIISAIMTAGDLLDGAFPRDGAGGSRFADELVILDQ